MCQTILELSNFNLRIAIRGYITICENKRALANRFIAFFKILERGLMPRCVQVSCSPNILNIKYSHGVYILIASNVKATNLTYFKYISQMWLHFVILSVLVTSVKTIARFLKTLLQSVKQVRNLSKLSFL